MTPESLLLLEDDALLAEQTRRAFARHGIEVHHAADLQQAHALLATLATLDAAVLDQNLGNDNGLDLIQPLLARFPNCRVLVLTGYGSIATALEAMRLGATHYLTKPADVDEVIASFDRGRKPSSMR